MMSATYDAGAEPIVLSRALVDTLLDTGCYPDLMALYVFYYYTAKWQRTNQPKCTNSYVAKGIGWSKRKVMKLKGDLIALGLLENIRVVDATSKRVTQWYVKVNFIWTRNTLRKYAQTLPKPTPREKRALLGNRTKTQ